MPRGAAPLLFLLSLVSSSSVLIAAGPEVKAQAKEMTLGRVFEFEVELEGNLVAESPEGMPAGTSSGSSSSQGVDGTPPSATSASAGATSAGWGQGSSHAEGFEVTLLAEPPMGLPAGSSSGSSSKAQGDSESSQGDSQASQGDSEASQGDSQASQGDSQASQGDSQASQGDSQASQGDSQASQGDSHSLSNSVQGIDATPPSSDTSASVTHDATSALLTLPPGPDDSAVQGQQQEESHFEEFKITPRNFTQTISRKDLRLVSLYHFKYIHKEDSSKERKLACKGSLCPSFSSCGDEFPGFEACYEGDVKTDYQLWPPPPENCPYIVDKNGENQFNSGCMNKSDSLAHPDFFPQVYRLKNVYVDFEGITFNESHVIGRNGCIRDREFEYNSTNLQVLQAPGPVMGLLYVHSYTFYHGLIEAAYAFVQAGQFLRANPKMTVAMTCWQAEAYRDWFHHLVGVSLESMNLLCIQGKGKALWAEELIQPVFQSCGLPSPGIQHELRRRYYLPQDGLPFFTPDWQPRGIRPLSPSEMAVVPEDWVVIMGQRPGKERQMVGREEVVRELEELFGKERVQLFNGTLPVLEAKKLFNRAALYVAVHGGAMTNMLFMPVNSTVLEMRPLSYPNACYHHLASACSIYHYIVYGEGSKTTSLVPDMAATKAALRTIAGRMRAPGRHLEASEELGTGIRILKPTGG